MPYDGSIPYTQWVYEEDRRRGHELPWSDARLEAHFLEVTGKAFQPEPGDYTTASPLSRAPISGLVAAFAAAAGHDLRRARRSLGGNVNPRGDGRRKKEPRVQPEAPRRMGEIGAKAAAFRGVSREAELAAGERWVCPTCGPVGTPFHGSDEQMHCPELECDEVVSAAIHVPAPISLREQSKRSFTIAQAKANAEERPMGRVKAEWGNGITRREFDQLRAIATRAEIAAAAGLGKSSVNNWIHRGAPAAAAQVELLDLLEAKRAGAPAPSSEPKPKPKKCSVCGTEFVPVAGGKPRCPSCKTQTRAPRLDAARLELEDEDEDLDAQAPRRPPLAGVQSPPEVEVAIGQAQPVEDAESLEDAVARIKGQVSFADAPIDPPEVSDDEILAILYALWRSSGGWVAETDIQVVASTVLSARMTLILLDMARKGVYDISVVDGSVVYRPTPAVGAMAREPDEGEVKGIYQAAAKLAGACLPAPAQERAGRPRCPRELLVGLAVVMASRRISTRAAVSAVGDDGAPHFNTLISFLNNPETHAVLECILSRLGRPAPRGCDLEWPKGGLGPVTSRSLLLATALWEAIDSLDKARGPE